MATVLRPQFHSPAQLDLFPTIAPAQWQDRTPPRREWMVDGLFAKGTVAMCSGDGGIGKSLIMQQLCTCAVLGYPWIGRRVQQGRAVYFGCEDDEDEMWRRQADINRYLRVEMIDVDDAGLVLSARVGRDNTLSALRRSDWTMQPTDLMGAVHRRCLELGAQYLVIDTLAQTFGGSMNDFRHALQYVSQLRRIATAIDGLVILISHPSMSGRALKTGEGGTVSWNNAVRSRVYLHEDKELGLVLEHKKSNYGKRGDKIPVVWRDGVYVVKEQATAPAYYSD